MEVITVESFGKINLSLDIVNKRKDGYHNIETIMQEIDLKDIIRIENRDSGIIIKSNTDEIPLNENNLVYKAWDKMCKKSGLNKGVEIYIEKNIPVSSGLAGGSSNAAAVLKGINVLWNLDYSLEELQEIGLEIGADVPFCLLGGTAYASGVGEILEVLPSFKDKYILLANNGSTVSTPYVYEALAVSSSKKETRIREKISYILNDDLYGLSGDLYNIMEDVVIKEEADILYIKNTMIEAGALGSLMSGSGPTVFGIFDNEEKMLACRDILKEDMEKVFISKTR